MSSTQPFPLSKLMFMYVKRIAQPIARKLIVMASSNSTIKNVLCLPSANLYNFYETKVKLRVMNIGKIRMSSAPKLKESDAVILGANLTAEFLLYTITSGVIISSCNSSIIFHFSVCVE